VALPKNFQKNVVRMAVSRSEEFVLFSMNSDISPTDFYLYNIKKKTYKQLTQALNPDINANDLVKAQAIRFRASDGIAIPALYYQPKEASPENKVPALIWVHGGPGGQSMRIYKYLVQFLVNQGYAVLAVNNRGSSGYGKTFYGMADNKHGEIDLKDCLEGKKYLIDTGVIHQDQIGIIGDSYGGFLTLAALAFHPKEIAAGIDLFGVSNWPRTLESIPVWWEKYRQMMYQKIGHPETDAEYLKSISPLFHAHKITRPLMVLQGANDPRVLQIESDEIIAAVDQSNVPYRYLVFDDEGHGFTKDRNKLLAAKAILEFLKQHLSSSH
jgi:dipeptidyl aminopeptidase/acylaminoacyl peptidase